MKAIILAGGKGLRLRPAIGDIPKPMALLAGRPILEHILALLKENGISHVCIALAYRPEVITEHFGDGSAFGIRIEYHLENRPLGTAGAVRACPEKFTDRDFLVIAGDCAFDGELRSLMEAHRRHGSALTMALKSVEQPLAYGGVLTEPGGRIVAFREKPAWERVISDTVNTGIYVVSPRAMDYVPRDSVFDFASDLFPRLMAAGEELRGLPVDAYWCDIGSPEAYYRCNLDAIEGRLRLPLCPPDCREAQAEKEPERRSGLRIPCRSRARCMRELSRYFMEAGADLTAGLELSCGSGKISICPSAEKSELIVSATDPELAEHWAQRVREAADI